MTLTELIAAIEAGPVTRDLEDRVLRACCELYASEDGDHFYRKHGTEKWIKDDGYGAGLTPLTNLQDATLAVPEGWQWALSSVGTVEMYIPHSKLYEPVFARASYEPARALVLAGLKAEQAKREAEG